MTPVYHLTNLRLLGLLVALVSGVWAFHSFRRNRISPFLFLAGEFFAWGLFVVSLWPNVVNVFLAMLSLKPQEHARLIALLIISNFFLIFAFFHLYRRVEDQDLQTAELAVGVAKNDFYRRYPNFVPAPVMCIIPAYNEAENIGVVLKRMPRQIKELEVKTLVVDDCSDDQTAEVAQAHGAYVARLPMRMGGGAAIKAGFMICLEKGARYLVTLDADGQHHPEEIERLLEPLLEGEAEVVVGSRILGQYENYSRLRTTGVRFFSGIISFLTACEITDCSSGFRAFKAEVLWRLRLRKKQYHTSELIIEAVKKGARITEVPITISRRLSGTSKKGRDLLYGARFAKVILKTWLRGSER